MAASDYNAGGGLVDDEAKIANDIFDYIVSFLGSLKHYIPLYFVMLIITWGLVAIFYTVAMPRYTASATLGPPSQSGMMSSMSGGLGGSVRSLLGGHMGGGSDPFQEYLQVLQSPRLAEALTRQGALPLFFPNRWDEKTHSWHKPGVLHPVVAVLKRAFKRPVSDHPDADALVMDLSRSLDVSSVSSTASSILSMGTPFMQVSFEYGDPRQSEMILRKILRTADDLIRAEQRRDVVARIDYITRALKDVTNTEQRQALIQALSHQEDMRIMIEADKRFAFTMVNAPHASSIPTSPMSPVTGFILSIAVAFVAFALLVFYGEDSQRVARILARFDRRQRRGTLLQRRDPTALPIER